MSIVDKGSVLVLGAGVSAPFGMPLGGDLIDGIHDQLEKELKLPNGISIGPPQESERTGLGQHNSAMFMQFPILSALGAKLKAAGQSKNTSLLSSEVQRLRELQGLLRNQTAETIDAFIAENPAIADLTKLAIAAMMTAAMARSEPSAQPSTFRAVLKDHGARTLYRPIYNDRGKVATYSPSRNWVHLLIGIVRFAWLQGEGRQVHVISFNYDPLLEFVLEQQWRNVQRGEELPPWDHVFQIVHPHGRFPLLPQADHGEDFWAAYGARAAEEIHVVNEPAKPQSATMAARHRARRWVREARRIYVAGFAFSRPNSVLLGLDQISAGDNADNHEAELVFCNYNGSRGVKLAAERYGTGMSSVVLDRGFTRLAVTEHAGSQDRPLGVSDFILAGLLGDMPG